MDYNLEISKLESSAELVKVLAKIAIISTAFSITILLFGFDVPDPIIFLSILLIPIFVVLSNNFITKYYQIKIEYLSHELLAVKYANEFEETASNVNQSNFANPDYLRNRGTDEKGPAFHTGKNNFSTDGERVDAMSNRDYDNIESAITKGEEMLRDANAIQAENSAKQWQSSESLDTDLIESGVDNLGDLIKTGWFEKNKQDGAVKRLYENNEGNQI